MEKKTTNFVFRGLGARACTIINIADSLAEPQFGSLRRKLTASQAYVHYKEKMNA